MELTFLPLGTTHEIGDACYFLELDGTSLLLDAGVHPRKDGAESLPDFSCVQDHDIDGILISHCHLDHIGSLPVALTHFPYARVFMPEASAVLAPIMLHHTVRVMDRLRKEGISDCPLYTSDDVDTISYVFQGMGTDRDFPIYNLTGQGADLTARFYDAGHVLGAAGIHLRGPSATLFYTGDTAAHDQELIPGAIYPDGPVDVLISECTLAADPRFERRKRKDETRRFAWAIDEVIQNDGSVLIPAFSLGRTQETLALLCRLRDRGRIPDVDIYTAGFGGTISAIYDRTARYTRRRPPGVRVADLDILPLPMNATRGPHLRRPAIIVVSSGMMATHTLSWQLARVMLPCERHGIFFVGYVDPEMPGHRVLSAAPNSHIRLLPDGPETPVRSRIERFRFSAHSSRRHLVRLVDRLRPGVLVLVHGALDAQQWLHETIAARHPETRIVCPKKGGPVRF